MDIICQVYYFHRPISKYARKKLWTDTVHKVDLGGWGCWVVLGFKAFGMDAVSWELACFFALSRIVERDIISILSSSEISTDVAHHSDMA